MRTLAEWLRLQESVHARSIDLGLGRVASVARALGIERPARRVITVGGTNGKGSTVAFLEAMLCEAGVPVGAFTSPHLMRYHERIRVQGVPVGDEELIEAFERIERARGTVTLTFFEFSTLAALCIFVSRRVVAAVLEVGLGGRLDATNLVEPDVAVVCSVGLDHSDWLGDSLDAIGAEKAGIFRAGRPAVLGTPDMPASVFERLDAVGAQPWIAERDFTWERNGPVWSYHGPSRRLSQLPPPALTGAIQYRNAATAMAALDALGEPELLEEGAVRRALRVVRLPGRFQVVPGPVEWILDVAHNEPAARVLADNLRSRPRAARTYAVAGILGDKDVEGIGRAVGPLVDHWILCSLAVPRGIDARDLAQRLALPEGRYETAPSVEAGCDRARSRAVAGDRVVVFGSFLTVGPALEWLRLY